MSKEDKRQLSGSELEQVAGGGVKEQIAAGVLGISALVSPMDIASVAANENKVLPAYTSSMAISDKKENLSIVKYLTEKNISKAQENAFKITNGISKKYGYDHKNISKIVSSERYHHQYGDERATDLESGLDKDVKNGDLPLPNFSVEDMQNARNKVVLGHKNDVKFVLYPSFDAMKLHETKECRDGDIVNLASQFNALESMSNEPTSVKYWYMDKTQGPYCALQSIAATKHREAAHLQNKLTDGLKEALDHCIVDGKPITEKHPELYKGGYLEMMAITDENDMKQFLEFLENKENLSKYMKVLMQWVKCEGTGKKQLQFFTAAPSFQGYSKTIWNVKSNLMNLRRQACVKLVEIQYRAMAQAAAIMAAESGKSVRLHVTMVGHGVFNNPPETVPVALKALKEELSGVDATVFLHNRPNNPNVWEQKGKLKELGIDPISFDNWGNSRQDK